jgi:DNA-binding protein YbaB
MYRQKIRYRPKSGNIDKNVKQTDDKEELQVLIKSAAQR